MVSAPRASGLLPSGVLSSGVLPSGMLKPVCSAPATSTPTAAQSWQSRNNEWAAKTEAVSRPAVSAKQEPVDDGSVGQEVTQLTQWAQKNKKRLSLVDLGQDMGTGEFFCQAMIYDIPYEGVSAPTKREAKRHAAALAIEQLGL